MEIKSLKRRSIQLSQGFAAMLSVVLVAVLIIVAIFLFVSLGDTFTDGTAESNATNTMITQFGTYPVLVGLVGTIVLLGLVIGVLIGAFFIRGGRV